MNPPAYYVLARRIIDQQREMLIPLVAEVNALAEDPPANSVARADLDFMRTAKAAEDLEGLRWWAARSVSLDLHAAEEHARGLREVLASTDEMMPLPAMSLARSSGEAMLHTCWLLDSATTREERLARWCGRLLHDTQEPLATVLQFGFEASQAEVGDTTEARALAQNLMKRAGFELETRKDSHGELTQTVTYAGARSRLSPRVDQSVGTYVPIAEAPACWTVWSGAAHSRGWMVAGLEGDGYTIVASIVAPLLDISDALIRALTKYFGLEARPLLGKTHQRRTAVLGYARPGGVPGGLDHYYRRNNDD